jgi:hypothetical protein
MSWERELLNVNFASSKPAIVKLFANTNQDEVQHRVWLSCMYFENDANERSSDLPVLFPYPRIYPGKLGPSWSGPT